MYGIEISPTFISNITDSIKEDKQVVNKAVQMALVLILTARKNFWGYGLLIKKVISLVSDTNRT